MNPMIETIKQLRSETGAGIMECRHALDLGNQNYLNALAILRGSGAINAPKGADREAKQSRIEVYSHGGGRVCAMVEINTETEFASRSEVFCRFAREIAIHVTAASPLYVSDSDIPQMILDEQAREASDKARLAGKPAAIIEWIIAGVLEKYRNRHVLLRQAYVRDENISVSQLLNRAASQIGENIVICRFARWEINPDSDGE